MFLRFLLSVMLFLFSVTHVSSQILVTNTLTPAELINDVLTGAGVLATNITVNGSTALANTIQPSASYFSQNGSSFPIADGLLLTTGAGSVAVGPNTNSNYSNSAGTLTVSDPDLLSIAGTNIFNGIVIEFDFVATGDYLEFNFLFGSEEYPEFAPPSFSLVNDVFGFFLSGMGVAGTYSNGAVNIATVPGNNMPVSIDNVNPITNSNYYVNNLNGLAYGNAIQYDGTTTTLTAFSQLVCGETYHIKMGIANAGDMSWDSGVFLEGGSFTTNPLLFSFDSYAPNNTIYEGCSELANLVFSRGGCGNQNDTIIAYINYSGTATNGTDYLSLPSSVVLPPGVYDVIWQVNPIDDVIPEGIESIELEIISINAVGDTFYAYATFYIAEAPPFDALANDVTLSCLLDSADVFAIPIGGTGPYTYSWSNGATDSLFSYLPTTNGSLDYYVTITDVCGFNAVDTATITMAQTLLIDTLISYPSSACAITGAVSAFAPGATGVPLNQWTGPGANSPNSIDATVWQNLASGWYYFTVTDDICETVDSVYVDVAPPPISSFTANPLTGCTPQVVTFVNNSQNATGFEWNFGGTQVMTTGTEDQVQTITSSVIVELIAIDAGGCADTTYELVSVSICGCTHPAADNYDPSATLDDGSCFFPQPNIHLPNVFTPNGDNQNDLFFIDVHNALDLKFMILNRWGNVIYETSGLTGTWNGLLSGGSSAQDGTYFVHYVVTGIDGKLYEGHGFVQLIDGLNP